MQTKIGDQCVKHIHSWVSLNIQRYTIIIESDITGITKPDKVFDRGRYFNVFLGTKGQMPTVKRPWRRINPWKWSLASKRIDAFILLSGAGKKNIFTLEHVLTFEASNPPGNRSNDRVIINFFYHPSINFLFSKDYWRPRCTFCLVAFCYDFHSGVPSPSY